MVDYIGRTQQLFILAGQAVVTSTIALEVSFETFASFSAWSIQWSNCT